MQDYWNKSLKERLLMFHSVGIVDDDPDTVREVAKVLSDQNGFRDAESDDPDRWFVMEARAALYTIRRLDGVRFRKQFGDFMAKSLGKFLGFMVAFGLFVWVAKKVSPDVLKWEWFGPVVILLLLIDLTEKTEKGKDEKS